MLRTIRRRRSVRPGAESLESRRLMTAAGSLDSDFGGGTGSAAVALGVTAAAGFLGSDSLTVEPDGHVLVSGNVLTTSTDASGNPERSQVLAIGRFDADGSIDTSFGIGGVARLAITPDHQPFALAVQPDGKILAASGGQDAQGNATYVVVRFDADGTIDAGFGAGGGGVAEYPASTGTDRLSFVDSVLLTPGGQIVLVGSDASASKFAAVRLGADGALDTSYGTGGTATVPVAVNGLAADDIALGAALQADGKVVLVGTAYTGDLHASVGEGPAYAATDVAAVRLDADGTLDTTFGAGTGSILLPPDPANPTALGTNGATAVAVQPADQKIVVTTVGEMADTQGFQNLIYRFDADGSPDASFGTAGKVAPNFAGFNLDIIPQSSTLGALAIEPDGKIVELDTSQVVSGGASVEGAILVRLNTDGSTDATFGNSTTPAGFQPGLKRLQGDLLLAVEPGTGDVVLAGTGMLPSTAGLVDGFSVARVLAVASPRPAAAKLPDTPPASFDDSGLTNPSLYVPATGSFLNARLTYTVAFGSAGAGQSIPAAADYLGAGYDQLAVYLPSVADYAVKSTSGSTGQLVHIGIAGAGQTIPVPADYEGTGKADIAIYMPSIGAYAILPSDGSAGKILYLGTPGLGQSIPAPADYFGTGQADPAVYLTNFGAFAITDPSGKTTGQVVQFGTPGLGVTVPVPGDYDGSGHVELAVYVAQYGEYFYRPFAGGPDVAVKIGTAGAGEIAVPGDYDGSGHLEFAIDDPAGAFFEYRPAGGGADVVVKLGAANDGSIPAAASPGNLPGFSGTGSGSGSGRSVVVVVPSSSAATAKAAVATATSSGVPAGPRLATARVARALVNQASPDPIKLGS